jgi:putative ABC transport system permease protein
MKTGYYSRLAVDGIRKNRRLYLPYLLTCVLMVAMFYILSYLSRASFMAHIGGGSGLAWVMHLGSFVIAVFSVFFLFYTNSFLIRRRKKEFGLFNILGMDKRSISRILFRESLIVALVALAFGLGVGIALSKMAELALVNLVEGDITFDFTIPKQSVLLSLVIYGALFLLIFLNAVRQVRFSKPIELMRSENFGEKPPKANWLFGLAGFALLGAAYYIAVSIENPIAALSWFFIAVLMVIAATYLIFIAGSVLLCRILQKNKGYYYNKKHFVSVSSMVYRMKRNGAGLASICILLTMVLVMISSTTCLYYGKEDSLKTRYPRDISVTVNFTQLTPENDGKIAALRETVDRLAGTYNADMLRHVDYREAEISGSLEEGGYLEVDVRLVDAVDFGKLVTVHFVPLEDYTRMYGKTLALGEGEAAAFGLKKVEIPESITIAGKSIRIVETLDALDVDGLNTAEMLTHIFLIVPDLDRALEGLLDLVDYNGNRMLQFGWHYAFDTDIEPAAQIRLVQEVYAAGRAEKDKDPSAIRSYYSASREADRQDFYSMYGGLFFLGLMLSIVFLVAAVLMIYYKQISEGYEDQSRFDIMQKVGMTKPDIRKSINSQMLTVFFLPIVFAVLHLAFAFPMIRKLLLLFNLNNVPLLIFTTAISILVFSAFYAVVYRITSNAYFSIVSDAKAE